MLGRGMWVALWATAFVACGGTEELARGLRGRVTQDGHPLKGALVFLSTSPGAGVETDAEGRFALDAPAGVHELTARYLADDGALNELHILADTATAADVELRLPRPTRLAEPAAASADTAQVSWNAYEGADFREYKLYRATSPALDETTGTLVYVGVARGETQFVDEAVRPGDVYYYRLFVMNDYGRLAGSNIARLAMPNANLIADGDFEQTAPGQMPPGASVDTSGWREAWVVSDAKAYSGTHALRGSGQGNSLDWIFGVTLPLPRQLLVPGALYRLSLMYQREVFDPVTGTAFGNDQGTWETTAAVSVRLGPDGNSNANIASSGVDTGWQPFSMTFRAPAYIEDEHGPWGGPHIQLYVRRATSDEAPDWVFWVDDLKLERVLD